MTLRRIVARTPWRDNGTIRRAAHERAGVKPGPRRQRSSEAEPEIRLRCDQKTSDRALTQRAVREANFPEEALGG